MLGFPFTFFVCLFCFALAKRQWADKEIEHDLMREDVEDRIEGLRELGAPQFLMERVKQLDIQYQGDPSMISVHFTDSFVKSEDKREREVNTWKEILELARMPCKVMPGVQDSSVAIFVERGVLDLALVKRFILGRKSVERVEHAGQAYFKDGREVLVGDEVKKDEL